MAKTSYRQQIIRMAGPGSDKVRSNHLSAVQRQGMLAQALNRLTGEFMGPQAKPMPVRIDVVWQQDKEGFQCVLLVPRME